MVGKPAFLITESYLASLNEHAIQYVSFEDIARTPNPWEIDFDEFVQIREKVSRIEKRIRANHGGADLACICTDKGIHWLEERGFQAAIATLTESFKCLNDPVMSQLWRWTSSEIAGVHANNLRMLILGSAHDLVLLQNLRSSLGRNHALMHREFKQCERVIWNMIENTREDVPKMQRVSNEKVALLERCIITQELLTRGLTSEDDLGYNQEQLNRVFEILEHRCEIEDELNRVRVQGIHNELQHNLRKGESTHLTRMTRWDMTFAMMDSIPAGFQNQFKYCLMEHQRVSSLVHVRESESGPTEFGQQALSESDLLIEKREAKERQLASGQSKEENENRKNQPRRRMAVLERMSVET